MLMKLAGQFNNLVSCALLLRGMRVIDINYGCVELGHVFLGLSLANKLFRVIEVMQSLNLGM